MINTSYHVCLIGVRSEVLKQQIVVSKGFYMHNYFLAGCTSLLEDFVVLDSTKLLFPVRMLR